MDHMECRKRIGQLEDDLEYNLGRKDQLKFQVKELDEDNDKLRKTNFKNAEESLKKELVMKKLVETLRKENEELKSNKVTNPDFIKQEYEKIGSELKAENEKLRQTIGNLLCCDECNLHFDDKTSLRKHIKLNH